MKKLRSPLPPLVQSKITLKSLSDLKRVQKLLQQNAKEAELNKKRLVEQARQIQSEKNLFRHSVGHVLPLQTPERAKLYIPKPAPFPQQRIQDERNALQESLSDEFDVETLLDTDEALSYRQPGIGPDIVRKLRRGHWALQDQLDLHGLRRDEAREALGVFLRESIQQGLRCVRIVHGKGHGSPGKTPVLKSRVQSWLAQKNDVLAYTQARAADGGAGALIVLLRTS